MKHRSAIGGMWDEIGALQFDYLTDHGLQPHHRLLDIGCGSLRGGVRFIPYLDPGNYYGIEKEAANYDGAVIELARAKLQYRRPHLLVNGSFDFDHFGVRFDYALAQSVFTHLVLNDIIVCLVRAAQVLKPGGKLFATFFEDDRGLGNIDPITWEATDGKRLTTYATPAKSMHYPFIYFEWIAWLAGLDVDYVGEWDHPRRQRMMVFTKGGE